MCGGICVYGGISLQPLVKSCGSRLFLRLSFSFLFFLLENAGFVVRAGCGTLPVFKRTEVYRAGAAAHQIRNAAPATVDPLKALYVSIALLYFRY